MKKGFIKFVSLATFLASTSPLFAANSQNGSALLLAGIIGTAVLLVLGVIIMVSDNLISIEAKNIGGALKGKTLSVLPDWSALFKHKLPDYLEGEQVTVLKKGFDISLLGEAEPRLEMAANVTTFAIQPPNFKGIAPIPKMEVEIGASVKAGDSLFHDKLSPAIKYTAPVSGEIIAINRGDKRAISEVVILADKKQEYRTFRAPSLENASREAIVEFLLESGAWLLLRQRPFDIVAEPEVVPRDIFISTFDTAPLAPDNNFVVAGKKAAFQKGIEVLRRLTSGKVFLSLDANHDTPPAAVFTEATGVEKRWFYGKHPAGNVGVQIHHIAPMKLKDKVWTLGVQEVITLGTLFEKGIWDTTRIVALTGAELKNPCYLQTNIGANIGDLLKGNAKDGENRFISGDVLTGQKKTAEQFLNFHDDQVTVVSEGNYFEIFGWLLPQKGRPSASKSYPNGLFPNTKYVADTNTHGELRAFVVTGQYEDVLPMDIYPQHLMKAIITKDIEKMEGLGIHELIEEDVALCEFVCTSKQPLQQILREGLDMMRAES